MTTTLNNSESTGQEAQALNINVICAHCTTLNTVDATQVKWLLNQRSPIPCKACKGDLWGSTEVCNNCGKHYALAGDSVKCPSCGLAPYEIVCELCGTYYAPFDLFTGEALECPGCKDRDVEEEKPDSSSSSSSSSDSGEDWEIDNDWTIKGDPEWVSVDEFGKVDGSRQISVELSVEARQQRQHKFRVEVEYDDEEDTDKWLGVSPDSGSIAARGTAPLSLTPSVNDTWYKRSARIMLYDNDPMGDGALKGTIPVVQEAKSLKLSVSPDKLQFTSARKFLPDLDDTKATITISAEENPPYGFKIEPVIEDPQEGEGDWLHITPEDQTALSFPITFEVTVDEHTDAEKGRLLAVNVMATSQQMVNAGDPEHQPEKAASFKVYQHKWIDDHGDWERDLDPFEEDPSDSSSSSSDSSSSSSSSSSSQSESSSSSSSSSSEKPTGPSPEEVEKPKPKCPCDDNNSPGSTSCGMGSVDYSIDFGRFPGVPGMKAGKLELLVRQQFDRERGDILYEWIYNNMFQRHFESTESVYDIPAGTMASKGNDGIVRDEQGNEIPYQDYLRIITETGHARLILFGDGASIEAKLPGTMHSRESWKMVTIDGVELLEESHPDGTLIYYPAGHGRVVRMITPDGVVIEKADIDGHLDVIYETIITKSGESPDQSDGRIIRKPAPTPITKPRSMEVVRQVWSQSDGLLDINGGIRLYGPGQIEGKDPETGLYQVKAGAIPLKTWSCDIRDRDFKLKLDTYPNQHITEINGQWCDYYTHQPIPWIYQAGLDYATIVEQKAGGQPYPVRWDQPALDVLEFTRGSGDEAVTCTETRKGKAAEAAETNLRITYDNYALMSKGEVCSEIIYSKRGAACENTTETYQRFEFGDALMQRVEHAAATGTEDISPQYSEGDIITQYFYDQRKASRTYGRLMSETRNDGSYITYSYDNQGRIIGETTPWSGGGQKFTATTWCNTEANAHRVASVTEYIINELTGAKTLIKRTQHVYELNEQEDIMRQTTTVNALGLATAQVSVSEWHTYRGALHEHPTPWIINQPRYSRDHAGVETLYRYEASSLHGSLYRQIIESRRANGAPVAGKSLMTTNYINDLDLVVRSEQYVHMGSRQASAATQPELWFEDSAYKLVSWESYQYDQFHKLIRTEQSNGCSSSTEWMCSGPLRQTDQNGVTTQYGYNSRKQLIESIRSATAATPETVVSMTRDGMDRITATLTDVGPMRIESSTQYDLLGRIVSQTDEMERITTYSYTNNGLVTTVTAPTGATLVSTRHADGSTLSQTGTGRQHVYYQYALTAQGFVTTQRLNSLEGPVISETLTDGLGRTISEKAPNTSGGFITTLYTYDAKGELIATQTGDLAPTLYQYDQLGGLIKQTIDMSSTPMDESIITLSKRTYVEQDGETWLQTVSTRYNDRSEPLTETTLQMVSQLSNTLESKTITIDVRGNSTAEWVEFGEDLTLRIRKQQVPGSEVIAVSQEVDGFITSQTDHQGVTSTFSRQYTAQGPVTVDTDARNNATTTRYDKTGRVTSQTDAAGNTTTWSYHHASGQPECITDAMGNTTCYRYDIRGRKTAEYGTGAQPSLFGYDEADNLVSLTTFRAAEEGDISTDPTGRTDGDTTTWQYHPATKLILRKTYDNGSRISYTYDSYNRRRTINQVSGITFTYSYEPLTGLLSTVTNDDYYTPNEQYMYNYLGQLQGVYTADGTTHSITYNQYGEPETESVGCEVESMITRKYDPLGRYVGYQLDLGGQTVQNTTLAYDSKGRLAATSLAGLNSPWQYSYDPQSGLPSTLSYPNAMVRNNVYEEKRNLLTSLHYSNQTCSDNGITHSYAYDALARPTQKQDVQVWAELNHTADYEYNNRGELISFSKNCAPGGCYAYDNIGNRTFGSEGMGARNYQSNELNQYASAYYNCDPSDRDDFYYDSDGNQTFIKTDEGIWEMKYDANSRPILFVQGSTHIECRYDYRGRRVFKKVIHNDQTVSHVGYVYDDYLLIAQVDMMAEYGRRLQKTYLWDQAQPSATRPLLMSTWSYQTQQDAPSAEHFFYTHDAMKNVSALYDSYDNLRALYQYEPFGAIAHCEGDMAEENPFRFSSEYHDDELGLVYYNFRYYNPIDGRWISRDPIAEEGGFNLYGFVENAPSYLRDRLGLDPYSLNSSYSDRARHRDVSLNASENLVNSFDRSPKELNVGHIAYEGFLDHLDKTARLSGNAFADSEHHWTLSIPQAAAVGASNFIGIVDIIEAIGGTRMHFDDTGEIYSSPMSDKERVIQGSLGLISVALTITPFKCGSPVGGAASARVGEVSLVHTTQTTTARVIQQVGGSLNQPLNYAAAGSLTEPVTRSWLARLGIGIFKKPSQYTKFAIPEAAYPYFHNSVTGPFSGLQKLLGHYRTPYIVHMDGTVELCPKWFSYSRMQWPAADAAGNAFGIQWLENTRKNLTEKTQ